MEWRREKVYCISPWWRNELLCPFSYVCLGMSGNVVEFCVNYCSNETHLSPWDFLYLSPTPRGLRWRSFSLAQQMNTKRNTFYKIQWDLQVRDALTLQLSKVSRVGDREASWYYYYYHSIYGKLGIIIREKSANLLSLSLSRSLWIYLSMSPCNWMENGGRLLEFDSYPTIESASC